MELDRNERAARNQSLFREVNERVVELEQGGLQEVHGDGSAVRAICECANPACHEPIGLHIDAYRAIRSSPLCFLIKAGHEWPDVERVVSQHDLYIVVEKFGETGEIATELARRGYGVSDDASEARRRPPERRGGKVLRGLRASLEDREGRDPNAKLPLQVVVAFIAELEGPAAASLNI